MGADPAIVMLEAALRERLGPGAALGELRFDGPLLRVTGARVPLGSIELEIAEALVELGAGAPLAPLPLRARLVSLRGELRSLGSLGPVRSFAAPLELTGDGEAAAAWVHGTLRLTGATLAGASGEIAAPLHAEGAVEVGPGGFRVTAGQIHGPATSIGVGARGAISPPSLGHVVATVASLAPSLAVMLLAGGPLAGPAPLLSHPGTHVGGAASWSHGALSYTATIACAGASFVVRSEPGAPLGISAEGISAPTFRALLEPYVDEPALQRFPLPADLALGGRMARDDAGAWTGQLTATTARSTLALAAAIDPGGRADGSRLTGRLGFEDALALSPSPSPIALRPAHAIDLDLALDGPLADLRARGSLFAEAVEVGLRARPELTPLRVERVSASIEVDRRRLSYRDARGTALGAELSAEGAVSFEPASVRAGGPPLARLRVDRAPPALLAQLAAIAGVGARQKRSGLPPVGSLWIPEDLALSGELVLAADGAASATIDLTTRRSRLDLRLALAADRSLAGSTLRGRVSLADALALGLVPFAFRPSTDAAIDLDARLTGKVMRPILSGRALTRRLTLATGEHPVVNAEDLSLGFEASPGCVTWHDLHARFYGGTIESSGALGPDPSGADLRATVTFAGVSVESLPLRIGEMLRGRAEGRIGFKRTGASGPLRARGQLKVLDPSYPSTQELTPALARYGLAPVGSRGTRPLDARFYLRGDEVHVESVTAAVDGLDLEGEIRVSLDGRLLGKVSVHLLESYLRRSVTLVLPAILAERVTLPVEVRGTVKEPQVFTDPARVLGRFMANNRIGDAVKSALDSLREAFEGPGAKPR